MQLAAEHGYTAIADVGILDANGSYDSYVILSHFKGHPIGWFGGAIKTMSIGIASVEGKCLVHSAGVS